MKELLLLLAIFPVANEYLVINDEAVLFGIAFATQGLIMRSMATLIEDTVGDSRAQVVSKYSEGMNQNLSQTYTELKYSFSKAGFLLVAVEQLAEESEVQVNSPLETAIRNAQIAL
jgi:hypothetical protein